MSRRVVEFDRARDLDDRTPPHDLDAERSILGAILLNNDAFPVAAAVIDAHDFYRDAHRRLFEAMTRLIVRGRAVDLVTLKDELLRTAELDDVGGAVYVAALVDGVPRSTNVEHYAGIVKEKAVLRQLIRTAAKTINAAYTQDDDVATIAQAARAEMDTILSAAPKGGVAAETIPFTTAADLARTQPAAPEWFVVGLAAPGVLTEVAGKLKASGKTTFVAHLLRSVLDGTPFLGQPTRLTNAVWLTEERPASFLETLKRAGLTERTDLHLVHWHNVKHLPWAAIVRACVRHAQQVGAGILVVDTVSQFAGLHGDAENNSGDALAAVAPLQEAAAHGLAVLALRHERKGGGEVGESGRGSSAFSGAVDIVVAIRRGEGQTKPTVRVLHTLSRFSETPETLVIELTDAGYVALGTAGTVAILEAERALLDRLPTTEAAALTLDDLLDGYEPRIGRTIAQAALRKLSDIGVQRIGPGKRGKPYRYFKSIDVSAATQITRRGRNRNDASDSDDIEADASQSDRVDDGLDR